MYIDEQRIARIVQEELLKEGWRELALAGAIGLGGVANCAGNSQSIDTGKAPETPMVKQQKLVLPKDAISKLGNPSILNQANSCVKAGHYSVKKPVYTISEQGKEFIKKNEGCVLKPYWDSKGWSAGYGHFMGGTEDKEPKPITKAQADAWFARDIKVVEAEINTFLNQQVNTRGYVVPQEFIDGLADFMYNCGVKRIDDMEFKQRVKDHTRWHDPYNVEKDLYYCAKFLRGKIIRAKVKLESGEEVYKVLPSLIKRRDNEADLMQKPFLYLVREQNR